MDDMAIAKNGFKMNMLTIKDEIDILLCAKPYIS